MRLFFRAGQLPYVWKMYSKNEQHLRLVAHIFTKLSQNVCLINTNILMYQHARCDCKLWKALWFYWVFCVFSYIFDDHLCLNCCIFTKLSLIEYLINSNTNIRCVCNLWNTLWFYWFFLGIFIHFWWPSCLSGWSFLQSKSFGTR